MTSTIFGWDLEQWAIACTWFRYATSRTPVELDDFLAVRKEWMRTHDYEPSAVEKTLVVPFGYRQEKDIDAALRVMDRALSRLPR